MYHMNTLTYSTYGTSISNALNETKKSSEVDFCLIFPVDRN